MTQNFQIAEDLDLVINIQRKFSYLQTIPGMFSIQRPPNLPIQNPCITKPNFQIMETNEISQHSFNKNEVTKLNNNMHDEKSNYLSMLAINLGRNSSQIGTSLPPPLWSAPPSLPNMSCNLGAMISTFPTQSHNNLTQLHETNRINNTSQKVKIEEGTFHVASYYGDQKGNVGWS